MNPTDIPSNPSPVLETDDTDLSVEMIERLEKTRNFVVQVYRDFISPGNLCALRVPGRKQSPNESFLRQLMEQTFIRHKDLDEKAVHLCKRMFLVYDVRPVFQYREDYVEFHREMFMSTPLHEACYRNTVGAIDGVLNSGIDVNDTSKNQYGITPLHVAVFMNHIEATSKLVSRGADVFAVDTSGRTTLHLACSLGHTEMFSVLVQLVYGKNETACSMMKRLVL